MKYAIIVTTAAGMNVAALIEKDLEDAVIYHEGKVAHIAAEVFQQAEALIFIGAMGICIRSVAPLLKDKHTDPAIINVDSTGQFAVSVLSGHVGGANELTDRIAHIIGATPVITTQSDNTNLWALDTFSRKFGWISPEENMNEAIFSFVNKKPVAVLLDVKDEGTAYLERTKPEHVDLFYNMEAARQENYDLLIIVSPFLYPDVKIPSLRFHPQVLHLGVGCRRQCQPEGISEYILSGLLSRNIAPASVRDIASIDLKKDEPLLPILQKAFGDIPVHIYSAEELKNVEVANPSVKVEEVTTVPGVCESTAILSAGYGMLVLEKQKGKLSDGNDFTFAVALDRDAVRQGHIEIVGAGPGDPDLISVRGRHFLEAADLVLYAGSLVPIELTYCCKPGAVVRSSASMNLEEQFAAMKEFYDRGKLVVRLHTGDPCIYGAIQEQMAYFDEYNMSYHITPGISSFLAAAAALRSQFTIPEKVQTIILTRGEGRTPMPEKEKLSLLARSQSTMCIFLSASVVEDVQNQLLEHYPPETPVAACYKLTWKDEKIYRGQLKELAEIVKGHHLTLTTMIVVGDAIDNRHGLSRLYAHEFKHLFRR
ncbi:MAG: precorrin-4 C(11)-methyltransferase [Dysgonamonadaceae bacterium]